MVNIKAEKPSNFSCKSKSFNFEFNVFIRDITKTKFIENFFTFAIF